MAAEEPKPVRRLAGLVAAFVALRTSLRAARTGGKPPPPAPEDEEVDPSERTVPANRRAETLVAVLLLAAAACGFGFTVIYIVLSGKDRKSTRLNSSHPSISYAVFCLKKKKM